MSYFGNTNFLIEVEKGNVPGHTLVHKFGRNLAVANGTWELIANLSGTYPWPAAATTVRVKSGGNAADTSAGAGARTISVEGLGSNLALASETITLAGASASSSTSTSFWRVFRAYVVTCGTYATPYNTGNIVIEDTAGSNDLLQINAEESQTQLCSYSVPTGKTAYLLSLAVQVDASKAADIRLCTRGAISDTSAPVSPVLVKHYADGIIGEYSFSPDSPFLTINGESDVFIEAEGGGAQTEVSADFELLLVDD